MRGSALSAIDAQLRPHLTGRYTRDDLLHATPDTHHSAVQAYLDHLQTAGALLSDPPPSGRSQNTAGRLVRASLPGATWMDDLPRPALRVASSAPASALERPLADPTVDVVVFGPADRIGGHLAALSAGAVRGRLVLACRPPETEPAFLDRSQRADCVLLSLPLSRSAPGRIEVVADTAQPFTRTRWASVPSDALNRLPAALSLIRPTAFPQHPLPSAEIDHPLVPGPIRLAAAEATSLHAALLDLLTALQAVHPIRSEAADASHAPQPIPPLVGPSAAAVHRRRQARRACTHAPPFREDAATRFANVPLQHTAARWLRTALRSDGALPLLHLTRASSGHAVCRSAHYTHAAATQEAAAAGVWLQHVRDRAGLPSDVLLLGVDTAHDGPGEPPPAPVTPPNGSIASGRLWERVAFWEVPAARAESSVSP